MGFLRTARPERRVPPRLSVEGRQGEWEPGAVARVQSTPAPCVSPERSPAVGGKKGECEPRFIHYRE